MSEQKRTMSRPWGRGLQFVDKKDDPGVRHLSWLSSFPLPDTVGLMGSSHRGKQQAKANACQALQQSATGVTSSHPWLQSVAK